METENILVAQATDLERANFYRKTYTHVALAILAFIVVETILINIIPLDFVLAMVGGKFTWLIIIGLFWLGSVMSEKLVMNQSKQKQYLGLGFYVLLEAIIFLPMIVVGMVMTESFALISQAALITLFLFGGLTAVVFLTKADFSFLRTTIVIGSFVSLGLIVAGAIFGFDLGLWFSAAMVALASAAILYQTNQIKDVYNTNQYVGASLQLFSSIMLLFWYVLRVLMSRRD